MGSHQNTDRMDKPGTIVLERTGGVATITLNRPEVRNAMNLQMIRELTSILRVLQGEKEIRLILFKAMGTHFCSGADLVWMKAGLKLTKEQLEQESLELASLFRFIHESDALTLCCVKGRISGGAVGLLAASDLVLAEESAILTFPEVKLGLVPATIAPYVLRKAGYSRSLDWMVTGRLIDAAEAREAGLIHRICGEGALDEASELLAGDLLSGGKEALKGIKRLLKELEGITDADELDHYTSRLIAGFRISPEGQEGMKAFLEKRRPGWDEGH
jgi:methylglutaconyl-CoA hydratase